MEEILKIIDIINSKKSNLNPTLIYNEGWMIRLLVFYSVQENLILDKNLNFCKINHWTSEALISSPFIYGSTFRESHTHADMALGDFHVDYSYRGEITVNTDAKLFGIIEAKMGSNLSQRTKHVSNYNQASRNIACIAYNTFNSNCETFFGVVAPQTTIKKHNLINQIESTFIKQQIQNRFALYPDEDEIRFHENEIFKKVDTCKIFLLSFEQWITAFSNEKIKRTLNDFYQKALKYNRIKP